MHPPHVFSGAGSVRLEGNHCDEVRAFGITSPSPGANSMGAASEKQWTVGFLKKKPYM